MLHLATPLGRRRIASALLSTGDGRQRRNVSIGGRATRPGFAAPLGRGPQIKQGTKAGVIPRHVPGTTKLKYTNQQGRTFTFSIPVSQLTHPPVHRQSPAPDGWMEIDTSFSDTGDLEVDMPTAVDECLLGSTAASEDAALASVVVEMDQSQLEELHHAFVQLCKEYVLMDTNGMKTSMMYAEINTGPDYELYDRKLRRRRHWLAIRHRFNDVKELLWPSELLQQDAASASTDGAPLLSFAAMMEALTWVEAASTFAVRTRRPYDVADAEDFKPLDLSREMRVLAARVQREGPELLFGSAAPSEPLSSSVLSSSAASSSSLPSKRDPEDQRAISDRFIAFAALCINHSVDLSSAFAERAAVPREVGGELEEEMTPLIRWLCLLPPLSRMKDAIRVMAVLQLLPGNAARTPPLCFSDAKGVVHRSEVLNALCTLAAPRLFSSADALGNIDEAELCVLMRFAVAVREQNKAFFNQAATLTSDRVAEMEEGEGKVDEKGSDRKVQQQKDALLQVMSLALARCRHLLYQLDGPQTSVLSGEEEFLPLVDLQRFTERTHPQALIHYNIGRTNGLGLRFARLQTKSSTVLLDLVDQLGRASSKDCMNQLTTDLIQHVAHRAALGKEKLSLDDVIRVLPMLAKLMRQTSEQHVKQRYDRLFSTFSTVIGIAIQHTRQPLELVQLLEGLSACNYVPQASFQLLEMAVLRLMMKETFSLSDTARILIATLQLVGPSQVSEALQQVAAHRVANEMENSNEVAAARVGDVLSVLGILRYTRYAAFPSLATLLTESPLWQTIGEWCPVQHCRCGVLLAAAAAALDDADESCERLSRLAREELLCGLSHSTSAEADIMTMALAQREDLLQECVAACAALDLPTPAVLSTWAHHPSHPHRAHNDGEAARRMPLNSLNHLHSLCTPLLAVSTLEAMEVLHLAPSPWYSCYEIYLLHMLSELEKVIEESQLLSDDGETVLRLLSLQWPSKSTKSIARRLLEAEVARLDISLRDGVTELSATQVNGPVRTFQQRSIEQRERQETMELTLLRYCAALRQHTAGAC